MSDDQTEPVFGFLFTGDTLFQTNPHGKNILISDLGENINMEGYHFEISEGNGINRSLQTEIASNITDTCETQQDAPNINMVKQEKSAQACNKVFVFSIVKDSEDNNNKESDNQHVIAGNVPFAIDNDNNSFSKSGVKVLFKRNGSKRIIEDDFVIKIQIEIDGETFSYSFKGYPAETGDKGNIAEAAIDFGSEASQIRMDSSPVKINEVFQKNYYSNFHRIGLSQNAVDPKKDLWQSDENHPDLYRSSYFIHKTPEVTKFGDSPNKNGEKTFVQALMPLAVEREYYNDFLLLPNLKLMDLMGNTSEEMMEDIKLDGESELLKDVTMPSLSDPHFRQNTLRLILSNLLHCAIASTNKNKKYLRLVMLMPNVYDQKKVYNIVEGLYCDFDIMKKDCDDKVKKFQGIEVSVISESDASFLGVLKKHLSWFENVPDAASRYYLIIDAGKGTTDFSVMHPSTGNITVWNSLFRGGLPASGHALTYAIYEAIWAFFKGVKNIDLDDVIRKADRAAVRDFMDNLEMLKANCSKFSQKPDDKIGISGMDFVKVENDVEVVDLSKVNEAIRKKIIEGKCLVEGTKKIMQSKVKEMSDLIVKGIKQYMDSTNNKEKFGRVFLAGRAFMLKEFKDALIKELINNGLVESRDDIKDMPDKELKTICLDGSAALSREYFINNNSELICRPVVSGAFLGKSNQEKGSLLESLGKWIKRKANRLGELATPERTNVVEDEDFYYDGIPITDSKNQKITMGLRSGVLPDYTSHIYYIGRGLLIKKNNGDSVLDTLSEQWANDDKESQMIDRLIRESLFPYYPSSIPKSGTHEPLYEIEGRKDVAESNNDGASGSSVVDVSVTATDGDKKEKTKEIPKISDTNGRDVTEVLQKK
ncbi:MAG: hypothetical protein IKQ94_08185 [Bacteroidales bacterium]|nr:hypothetical protein [Bacteroidales bacterium]